MTSKDALDTRVALYLCVISVMLYITWGHSIAAFILSAFITTVLERDDTFQ